jgi:hypothetical protein
MTKQQLKDYEKVQSLECLELWMCEGYSDLNEIPLKCAISDMEMIILDEDAENFGDNTANVIRLAKAFIRKYKAQ